MNTGIAQPVSDCHAPELVHLVSEGRDIYFGELHGTIEVPSTFGCLVTQAAKTTRSAVIVSLELQPEARDLNGWIWSGKDGRSSQAMWELVSSLLQMEAQGAIRIHFQLDSQALGTETQSELDRAVGITLRDLAKDGQLLALGGNFHSRKRPMDEQPDLIPAGAFVGPTVTHVVFDRGSDGSAWLCFDSAECKPHRLEASSRGRENRGRLVECADDSHDYTFYLNTMNASPPRR